MSAWRHLPNALSVLRMLLAIPVAVLLSRGQYLLTFVVFGFAAFTDALDGALAKHFGWTSELGKMLDPLGDKLLLMTVFITLTVIGQVPPWLALTAVGRDVLITSGAIVYRLWLGPIHGGRPTTVSKINTLSQIAYLLAVMESAALGRLPSPIVTGLGALVFMTTVISGLDYVLTYSRRAQQVYRARQSLSH
ncbi:MAG: CDP-alcohol phosphatidyltransferase family protein [Steroidobacteraceae bacterium]